MLKCSSSPGPRLQVLNLCVIAWQAIAAVAPAPAPAPASSLAPNKDETVKDFHQGENAMDVDADAAGAGANSSGEAEAQRPSRGGDDTAETNSGGRATSFTERGAFATDPLRGLVRCLCGVVVGRWKQAASTTAKAPKKVWVLHAMEAVHALVRTLEVGQFVSRRRRGKMGACGPKTGGSSLLRV